jgi:hypothetical protein
VETGELLPVAELFKTRRAAQLFVPLVRHLSAGQFVYTSIFHPPIAEARLQAALRDASDDVLASHFLRRPIDFANDEWAVDRAIHIEEALEDFAELKNGMYLSMRPALAALGDSDS